MFIISFLGQYVGLLLGYLCKDEFDHGKRYFEIILISSLILLVIFNLNYFLFWMFLLGLIIGFLLNKEYLYFGAFTSFLNWILIFIYGLAYGTLNYKTYKKLLLNILFVIPLFVLSFWFNLVPFALGGLFGCLIHKFKKLL